MQNARMSRKLTDTADSRGSMSPVPPPRGEPGVPQPDTADSDHNAPETRRNTSSSLRRALAIVMFLAEDRGHPLGATLTELATGLGLSKSTILRLVTPLREVRLVDQDPES